MIGVVGDGPVAERAVAAATAADSPVETGAADDVLAGDPDAVVAVGEDATVALARAGSQVPVLPVGAGPGLRSVPVGAVETAVEHLVAGEWRREDRRLLSVTAGGREATAVFDATLVTADPVRISEYGVAAGDGTEVARFRADGVVVASPAGSQGYARAAGGPVVDPESDAVAMVPVAPFTTDRRRWTLTPPVALTVEREGCTVSLLVDGTERGGVSPGETVTVGAGGSLPLATTPESRPFFDDGVD